jgi:hypothetical protein
MLAGALLMAFSKLVGGADFEDDAWASPTVFVVVSWQLESEVSGVCRGGLSILPRPGI